jgi:FtsP/CotA-like multicopper oxidase with cupredoxin domain
MERFIWGMDGKKFSEAPAPIIFRYGERLRLTMVNDTMMEHPMHLHGMYMYLENGSGKNLSAKHTILVKPAERLSLLITADAPPGGWAFHCHMLFHMEAGMFRVVQVVKDGNGSPTESFVSIPLAASIGTLF